MSHPTIYWAQNKQVVYMRIEVQDAADLKVDIQEEKFDFSCNSKGKQLQCTITLFKKVIPAESKYRVLGQAIEVILKKAEETKEFWATINAGGKLPYVRVDWERWLDEDEDEKPKQQIPDFSGMGGLGGMGGMEGMPDMSNFKMPEGYEGEGQDDGCGCGHEHGAGGECQDNNCNCEQDHAEEEKKQ